MNKAEIQKVVLFINEVRNLPDELLTSEDAASFSASESNQQAIYIKQQNLFETVNDIRIRLIAYFRAVVGENSTYIDLLSHITFKPQNGVFNTLHFTNNKVWLDDKTKLLSLLKMAKTEFEEKERIATQSSKDSRIPF